MKLLHFGGFYLIMVLARQDCSFVIWKMLYHVSMNIKTYLMNWNLECLVVLKNSTCALFSQGICKLDDDLPTCSEEVSETWEEESIGSDEPSLEEEEPDNVTYDLELPPPRITSYGGAIQSLEDLQAFLDYKGHSEQATMIASAIEIFVLH